MFSTKKYGHIISLGYNCEVSFQFFLKYHFVESSLFAWVNAIDCEHLIYALKNLSKLTTKGFTKVAPMYRDDATGICFHSKDTYAATEQELIDELTGRILHLKEKFLKTASDGKKNLYIFKYPPKKRSEKLVRKDIIALYETLNKMVKNDFDLLIIMDEKMHPNISFDIPNLYVRRVKFYTPESAVTSKPYDKKHFNKIFSEFRPNFRLPKNKRFKFEGANNQEKRKLFARKRKYDLIFSMGAACSCTSALRSAGLQVASYPLDWLFGSNFLGRSDIIVSDFAHFLDKKDLEFVFSVRSTHCDAYHNKRNDLTFNHDFEKDKKLSETYPGVQEKYNRRINRLLSNINDANKILIVYLDTPDSDVFTSDTEIKQGLEKIQKHFPNKHIDLVFVSPDNNQKRFIKKQITPNITRFFGNYKDTDPDAVSYSVNKQLLKKFFAARYKLNQPVATIIKKRVLKTLIKFIPSHNKRVALRQKYHLK